MLKSELASAKFLHKYKSPSKLKIIGNVIADGYVGTE